jgi:hypothetical protein
VAYIVTLPAQSTASRLVMIIADSVLSDDEIAVAEITANILGADIAGEALGVLYDKCADEFRLFGLNRLQ